MALADLLGLGATGSVADMLGLGLQRPPLGGFQFNLPQAAAVQPQAPAYHQPSKFRNFLGAIGDALLVAHGHEPMYQQQQLQQRENNALQGFLGDPDAAISRLMQINPAAGIEMYKTVHPASEIPLDVKTWEYEQKLSPDQRTSFEHVMQMMHPGMMAPITLDPGATVQMPGTVSGPPQTAIDYLKANPSLAPQFDEKYGAGSSAKILGGATAPAPSRTFPAR